MRQFPVRLVLFICFLSRCSFSFNTFFPKTKNGNNAAQLMARCLMCGMQFFEKYFFSVKKSEILTDITKIFSKKRCHISTYARPVKSLLISYFLCNASRYHSSTYHLNVLNDKIRSHFATTPDSLNIDDFTSVSCMWILDLNRTDWQNRIGIISRKCDVNPSPAVSTDVDSIEFSVKK